jgi:hypothetical protein
MSAVWLGRNAISDSRMRDYAIGKTAERARTADARL